MRPRKKKLKNININKAQTANLSLGNQLHVTMNKACLIRLLCSEARKISPEKVLDKPEP